MRALLTLTRSHTRSHTHQSPRFNAPLTPLTPLQSLLSNLRANIRTRRPHGQHGSFTFAVIFWALMAMILAGLVVDGGLAITERQRAGDIAEQAARAGADDLDPAALRAGNFVLAADSCARARQVVTASGLDAAALTCDPIQQITLATGQVVPTMTVHIRIQYSPILIGLIYSGQFVANAAATAHPQPGT
jgi:putative Flp pilus-assembly TadE/G-like protein